MSKFSLFFGDLFKDVNGKFSAKRVFGAICILSGIVVSFVKGATDCIPIISAGTLLLGAGTLEKPKVSNE